MKQTPRASDPSTTVPVETKNPQTEPSKVAKPAPARINRAQQARIEKFWKVVLFILLCLGSIVFLIPFWVTLMMSLKSTADIAGTPLWSWPTEPSLQNYVKVLTNENAPFLLFFRNTTVIAVLSTVGVLITSALAAYAFARLNFRGRDGLFIVLLATMMLPGIVTMIPTYVMYKYLSWVDSFLPLWVPAWFGGGAFNIFLLRQFYMGIPRELDEAAVIDGASHATIFWRIIMPLSGPALATVGIFALIYNWRDFMGPLLYLNDPKKQTLELGLRTYQTLNSAQWDLLMAASILVLIPLVILFVVGQKFFVRGIVMTGGK
ncbi:MAG: carbohydrate ABC transporter permease [Fimbriimonadaceae bacterium]|jgi:ABC-type glycerol-3-phosphate transport system permease component|nr:carbohydrate ABC transporter permease [Fimbriimonadaceae bacterium]